MFVINQIVPTGNENKKKRNVFILHVGIYIVVCFKFIFKKILNEI